MDWATQPNPFRQYEGAPLIALDHVPPTTEPLYDAAFVTGHVPTLPLTHHLVSQLFSDSLALSAWKQAGDSSWALRINPSSGNLHPTEGYLICGPIAGLCAVPMVCHYSPSKHALERRAEFPLETWQQLTQGLPKPALLLGLTSVHWREAWKYGERAYRYCQHDAGHAIAAISLAAAAQGWQATLLDDLGTEMLAVLLGVDDSQGAEAEEPDCVLVLHPQGTSPRTHNLPGNALETFAALPWQGKPNLLSHGHVAWPIIERVTAVTKKPATNQEYEAFRPDGYTACSRFCTGLVSADHLSTPQRRRPGWVHQHHSQGLLSNSGQNPGWAHSFQHASLDSGHSPGTLCPSSSES